MEIEEDYTDEGFCDDVLTKRENDRFLDECRHFYCDRRHQLRQYIHPHKISEDFVFLTLSQVIHYYWYLKQYCEWLPYEGRLQAYYYIIAVMGGAIIFIEIAK